MPNILLIEDNEMNRDMLARRLERRGFAVSVAVDGRQGIDSALMERPDLILMDLNLPEIDGWEATATLKDDPRTAHIPIVALTAHAMTNDMERAVSCGCDEFATKPVDFKNLLEKMETLMARASDPGHFTSRNEVGAGGGVWFTPTPAATGRL